MDEGINICPCHQSNQYYGGFIRRNQKTNFKTMTPFSIKRYSCFPISDLSSVHGLLTLYAIVLGKIWYALRSGCIIAISGNIKHPKSPNKIVITLRPKGIQNVIVIEL